MESLIINGGIEVIKLKCCPRCSGDISFDRDSFGWYEQCIQCGYLRDLPMIFGFDKSFIRASGYDLVLTGGGKCSEEY